MFVHEGSEVRVFTNSNDAIGEIVVRGSNLDECEEKINDVIGLIHIEIA